LQTLQTAIDHSNVVVGQLQHGFTIAERSTVTYGLDVQRTDPQTAGTVNGRNENDDVSFETGVYAQASTRLSPKLELIGAARVDEHSRVSGAVFSPRIALLFTPKAGHRFRVSYNRAFSTPTPGNLFLDVVAARLDPLPFTIRAEGVPKDGFHFARDCGGLCMASPFAPGQKLPVDATLLWPAVVQIMKASGVDISAIPAPKSSDVGTSLRALDLRNGAFSAYTGNVNDVAPLAPTITNSYEVGYKGLIGQRLLFDGSVYATRRKNFIAPLSIATPNVFLSTASLAAYLGRFMPAAQAGALAAGIGGVDGNAKAPAFRSRRSVRLGLVAAVIFCSRTTTWATSSCGAPTSRPSSRRRIICRSADRIRGSIRISSRRRGRERRISRPTRRATKDSSPARFRQSSRDLSVEFRGRYVDGFRMVDGVWNGNVDAFTVADLEAGIAIPDVRSARFT
jgi:iron complex outermembrane receptor protein